MNVAEEKPVVLGGAIAGAVSALWPAVLAVCTAFDIWDPTEAQLAAISGLWVAVIGVVTAFTSKTAASRVYVPSSVDRVVEQRTAGLQAEADERVRIAESFGRPDQNQGPGPYNDPVGGRRDP